MLNRSLAASLIFRQRSAAVCNLGCTSFLLERRAIYLARRSSVLMRFSRTHQNAFCYRDPAPTANAVLSRTETGGDHGIG